MLARKVLILSGVVICSLLACFDSYAVEVPDFVPDSSSSENVYDLTTTDGYSRKVSSRASASMLFSCLFEREGEINVFPMTDVHEMPDNNPDVDPSACGYHDTSLTPSQFEGVRGPYPRSSGTIGVSIDNYLNNHHFNLGTWVDYFRSSLNPYLSFEYQASSYVSAFSTFTPLINLTNPGTNYYQRFDVPAASGDGYAFYVFTLQNITPDYMNTSMFAPLLNDSVDITINSGSITSEEIISTINNSSVMGWVYSDSGIKKNTLKDCYAATSNNSCSRIIPEGESFPALENYLNELPVGTFFAVYAFPVSDSYSYTLQKFYFETPDDLTAYGYRFNAIENPDQFWGMPMLYSPAYHKSIDADDVLRYSGFATNLTELWIFPTTSSALSNSNYLAGYFNISNYNQISHQSNLSQIDPNPGVGFWGGIFNLSNIFFPFTNFFSGFSNSQCVAIPSLGSWLGLGTNVNYCSWWSQDIRNVLTPIFATSTMMLLFGFIIHWLRSDEGNHVISIGDKK